MFPNLCFQPVKTLNLCSISLSTTEGLGADFRTVAGLVRKLSGSRLHAHRFLVCWLGRCAGSCHGCWEDSASDGGAEIELGASAGQ